MLYHIKFLKVPTLTKEGLRAVLTLTNDLGDQLFHGSAEIGIESGKNRTKVSWKAGSRSVNVMAPLGKTFRATVLSSQDQLHEEPARFLDLYAVAEGPVFPAKALRRFDSIPLVIKEDSGNSIARHVWDSGVTLAHSLTADRLEAITGERDHVTVLELGAGCGIVGLAVEKHLTKAGVANKVILSDLEDARECAEQSMSLNSSQATFEALDWADPSTMTRTDIDLVLVVDCTYNMDMYDTLLACLEQLLEKNPAAKVVIGHKTRDEQESVFFDLLEEKLEVIEDKEENMGVSVRVVVAGKK